MIGADKMYNVLEYLEQSAERFPDKISVKDNASECTYSELVTEAKKIGTAQFSICRTNAEAYPIVVSIG